MHDVIPIIIAVLVLSLLSFLKMIGVPKSIPYAIMMIGILIISSFFDGGAGFAIIGFLSTTSVFAGIIGDYHTRNFFNDWKWL